MYICIFTFTKRCTMYNCKNIHTYSNIYIFVFIYGHFITLRWLLSSPQPFQPRLFSEWKFFLVLGARMEMASAIGWSAHRIFAEPSLRLLKLEVICLPRGENSDIWNVYQSSAKRNEHNWWLIVCKNCEIQLRRVKLKPIVFMKSSIRNTVLILPQYQETQLV